MGGWTLRSVFCGRWFGLLVVRGFVAGTFCDVYEHLISLATVVFKLANHMRGYMINVVHPHRLFVWANPRVDETVLVYCKTNGTARFYTAIDCREHH